MHIEQCTDYWDKVEDVLSEPKNRRQDILDLTSFCFLLRNNLQLSIGSALEAKVPKDSALPLYEVPRCVKLNNLGF